MVLDIGLVGENMPESTNVFLKYLNNFVSLESCEFNDAVDATERRKYLCNFGINILVRNDKGKVYIFVDVHNTLQWKWVRNYYYFPIKFIFDLRNF